MKIFLAIVLLFVMSQAKAQVGIDNPIPDSTSVLDLKSTTKGFLMPRMTSSQRNSIVTNTNSLMLFDTDLNKYMYWNTQHSQWAMFSPWYAEEDGVIHYGAHNQDFKVNIAPSGGSNIFRVSTDYNGEVGNSAAYQTEFAFTDYLIANSGVRFNAKVTGLTFILMQAFYNDNAVMTIEDNGNVGLGYTDPSKRLEVDGEMEVSGSITASKFDGIGMAPEGSIVMWSGSIASIPSGWTLCNGSNGTPDLRERFVVGAGSSYAVGNTGGANGVAITENQMPSHYHLGTSDVAGAHAHSVARNESNNGGNNSFAWYSSDGVNEEYNLYGHNSEANFGGTSTNGDHSHDLNVDNTGGDQPHENRPSFYALAFIMRIN